MAKKQAKVPLNLVITADGKIVSFNEYKVSSSEVEGGLIAKETAHFKSLLKADVVEEFHVTILPLIRGGVKAPTLTGLPEGFLSQERRFRMKSLTESEGVATLHYLRDRGKSPLKLKR